MSYGFLVQFSFNMAAWFVGGIVLLAMVFFVIRQDDEIDNLRNWVISAHQMMESRGLEPPPWPPEKEEDE